jgi:hypothetical protein
MSEELRYIPSALRPANTTPRDVLYGCGTEVSPGEFGMWWGPVPEEKQALECVGTSEKDVVVRFNADWTDTVLWRWDGEAWVSVGHRPTYHMTGDGYYGVVTVPAAVFHKLDSSMFISGSGDTEKFMCANEAETKHLAALGINCAVCDWYCIKLEATPSSRVDVLKQLQPLTAAQMEEITANENSSNPFPSKLTKLNDILTEAEVKFVEMVYACPGCKLHDVFSPDDGSALWDRPERLGLIECVGGYKWKPTKAIIFCMELRH